MRAPARQMMDTRTHAVSVELPIRDAIDVLIDDEKFDEPTGTVRKDVLRALRDLLPR